MIMQKDWVTVSTKLERKDYENLKALAEKEGKSESAMIKLAIELLFDAHPKMDLIKGLATSGLMEAFTPELMKAIEPIFSKVVETAQTEYNKIKEDNPELEGIVNVFKGFGEDINKTDVPSSDSEPKTVGRSKKSENKPKGIEALNSIKEVRKLEKEILKKNKKKDIIAKAVDALKKGEDPTLQVTEDLKKLNKNKP